MKKKIGLGCLTIIILVILSLSLLFISNNREASKRDRLFDSDRLGDEEKGTLREVLRLQKEHGIRVWPGLESLRPIVFFNDRYEFLIEASPMPSTWTEVDDDVFDEKPYCRRTADNPQAFALLIEDQWAASIGIRDMMNRDFFLGVRRQLPPFLAPFFPFKWASLSRDLHVVSILHEIFHAFQAEQYPRRFLKANAVYAFESEYPFQEDKFIEAWNEEGFFLAKALEAKNDSELREWIERFLNARENRRKKFSLSPEQVSFETELEWLEGLAKYVEIKFYELAASHGDQSEFFEYKEGLPHWKMEFKKIKGRLGHKDGDYRFYLSGMAQARLLDRIRIDWKDILIKGNLSLEGLLKDSIDLIPLSSEM